MTRETLLENINLIEELISTDKPNRQGKIIKPEKITIHNTSNSSSHADAKAHSRFVRETGYYIIIDPKTGEKRKNWVSWHFTVDDKVAVKQLPENEKAIHAGTMANQTSLAIEVCMHAEINQEAANEKAAQLAALLCYDLSIPLENVVTHNFWTGKNCPELLLPHWNDFKDRINFYLQHLKAIKNVQVDEEVSMHNRSSFFSEMPLCWNKSIIADDVFLIKASEALPTQVQNGFNDKFLGNEKVILPIISNSESHVFVHHQNISTYFNTDRKLAAYTACNYNKDALFEHIQRSNSFRDDTLIDSSFQLGSGFYRSATLDNPPYGNYFDQGHLIARRYNQWGASEDEAKTGERDTYNYTNIHPQVRELNQDEWEKLESFIIEKGKLDVCRVSIIAGAFLLSADPIATYIDRYYQTEKVIQVPQAFWKIVYYQVDDELRKIAFVMSQRNRLKELPFLTFKKIEMFVEDPFDKFPQDLKTYIVNSSIIESVTELAFSKANELYLKEEPLEVIMKDNETYPGITRRIPGNILQFI